DGMPETTAPSIREIAGDRSRQASTVEPAICLGKVVSAAPPSLSLSHTSHSFQDGRSVVPSFMAKLFGFNRVDVAEVANNVRDGRHRTVAKCQSHLMRHFFFRAERCWR